MPTVVAPADRLLGTAAEPERITLASPRAASGRDSSVLDRLHEILTSCQPAAASEPHRPRRPTLREPIVAKNHAEPLVGSFTMPGQECTARRAVDSDRPATTMRSPA